MQYLMILLLININGCQIQPDKQEHEMQNLYFETPQESVEIITALLKQENWEMLARYYYKENLSPETMDSLFSGSYFMRTEKPETAHPGGYWKYRNPFPPGFKYDSHTESGDNITEVLLFIKIDQGNNEIQKGFTSYRIIKTAKGYQLIT